MLYTYTIAIFACFIASERPASGTTEPPDRNLLGTVLYGLSDLAEDRKWTEDELIELRCRMSIGALVPGRVPTGNGAIDVFVKYFNLIRESAGRIESIVLRKRTMVLVADAIGSYLYARMLPEIRALYYEGKVNYTSTKRLHDLAKKIRYILDKDSRGWARPEVVWRKGDARNKDWKKDVGNSVELGEAVAVKRCGGVDAGPYGLLRRRGTPNDEEDYDDDDGGGGVIPLFDDDARPHSVVVPWRPRSPILYGVGDVECHRALYDHCYRAAIRSMHGHNSGPARNALTWLQSVAGPHVKATGRWCPALWGVALAGQVLNSVLTEKPASTDDHYDYYFDGWLDEYTIPCSNFYVAIILVSATVCWMINFVVFLCTRRIGTQC